MAKRKKRNSKKPNLPEATLKRARAQARGEEYVPEEVEDIDDEPLDEEAEEDEEEEAVAAGGRRRERRHRRRDSGANSRRRSGPSAVQYSRRNNDESDGLDNAALGNLLARPTKFVSEEELKEEYGYVVADVRNMFILAAALFVLLVVLAQFI